MNATLVHNNKHAPIMSGTKINKKLQLILTYMHKKKEYPATTLTL